MAIPLVDVPRLPSWKESTLPYLQKLQEWEGYVVSVTEDEFRARLIDLTAGHEDAKEEAGFLISDLTDDDRSLLREGAVFRWLIGYQRIGTGPKQRVSQIVFRRLPAWTDRDFVQSEKYADSLEGKIDWV